MIKAFRVALSFLRATTPAVEHDPWGWLDTSAEEVFCENERRFTPCPKCRCGVTESMLHHCIS